MNNIDKPDCKPIDLTINRHDKENGSKPSNNESLSMDSKRSTNKNSDTPMTAFRKKRKSDIVDFNTNRIQKLLIFLIIAIIALLAPIVVYGTWRSTTLEITNRALFSLRTMQDWYNYFLGHIGLIAILMGLLLLVLIICYLLLINNSRLKKSQSLLKENAENFKMITENINEMISKHSLDGRYTYLSPSCRNLTGYEPAELIGMDPLDLIHPESVSMVRQSHETILESPDIDISTYQIRCKDGQYIWVETSTIAIRDAETDKPAEIMCVSRNMTKKVELENLGKKMIFFTEELLQTGSKQISYHRIVENLLYISKAKIGFITLLNDKTGKFITQAIVSPEDILQKTNEILGYNLEGKEWEDYYADYEQIKNQVVSRFDSFRYILAEMIPKDQLNQIDQVWDHGEVAVVKIIADSRVIGHFTLIMPAGENLKNDYFVEIYSRQINMFMTRLMAEEKLITSETRLLSAQSLAHVGNWEITIATKQMWASNEAFNIYGIPYNSQGISLELVQRSVFPEYRQRLDMVLHALVTRNETYDEKFRIINGMTGKTRYVHSKAIRITDENGNPVKIVGAIQDITNYKKSEDEILYLSFHDQLTGLYNRRFYEERLATLDTPENLPISIVMGDVNGLKLVNDSFGHAIGDELLRKAAEVMQNGCREKDIVARLGGDEFVIILPNTRADETEKIIRHIKELSRNERAGAIDLSISFGYETKTRMEESIHEIFKGTEDHMYRQKLHESTLMRNKTIHLIINALYEKNHREMMHSQRVSKLCEDIAIRMNFDKDNISQIKIAGLMHDIGKIGIDNKILNKSGRFAKDEWKEMERHSEIGYRILSSVNEFSEIADYVLEHHERWDGTGYPRGLKGNEISLQARIIVFADSYDAMTGYQTYRDALSRKEALDEIRRCAGTQFDPEIAEIFIDMMENPNGILCKK